MTIERRIILTIAKSVVGKYMPIKKQRIAKEIILSVCGVKGCILNFTYTKIIFTTLYKVIAETVANATPTIPNCGIKITSENNEPEVSIPLEDGFIIPSGTPFEIRAIGTDVDGDALTYCWE